MSYSLNEVEGTSKKATRGAGYSWGLAEEAAKATRFLCRNSCDGVAALATVLRETDGKNLTDLTPQSTDDDWRGAPVLCPLIAGASVADHAFLLPTKPLILNDVICPELLLPFVALAASQLEQNVALTCGEIHCVTDGKSLSLNGDLPDRASMVSIQLESAPCSNTNPTADRAHPAPETWAALLTLAHRTYAPATAESREKGAGAGLTDND